MGSCTSKSKANMQNSIQQKISDHGWMKESKCLDKFSFDQSISNKQEYEKLQEKLSLLSLQIDLAFKESESQPNYNQSFATDTLEQVKKGLPNFKIADFLNKLFNVSQKFYDLPNEGLSKEFQSQPYLFGKMTISTNMLNTFGVASMQKILLKIHEEFSDLEYCPILPRVIQFFLWYVPEKVALKMVTLLIKKDISAEANLKVEEGNTVKFFSTSIISMKKLVKQGIPICKDVEEREKAKKIISELITEMFVNVLEVGHLPIVFLGYLVAGVRFLSNLAGKLYAESRKFQVDLQSWKKEMVPEINVVQIIYKTHKISKKRYVSQSSLESASKDHPNKHMLLPNFDSKIFSSYEKKVSLFSAIPKLQLFGAFQNAFSFASNGLSIQELNYFWHQASLASLLLIETKFGVIGIYFDRGLGLIEKGVTQSKSKIFYYTPEMKVFKHSENNELAYKFIQNKGIFIGNNTEVVVRIEYSLLDAVVNPANMFKLTDLGENREFQINNLELFLLS